MRFPQRFRIIGRRAEAIPPPPWTDAEFHGIDWTEWHHIVATTGQDASLTIDGREVPSSVAAWRHQTVTLRPDGEGWSTASCGSSSVRYSGSKP